MVYYPWYFNKNLTQSSLAPHSISTIKEGWAGGVATNCQIRRIRLIKDQNVWGATEKYRKERQFNKEDFPHSTLVLNGWPVTFAWCCCNYQTSTAIDLSKMYTNYIWKQEVFTKLHLMLWCFCQTTHWNYWWIRHEFTDVMIAVWTHQLVDMLAITRDKGVCV